MINKRGETESYSFLIGLIITMLLLGTVGCVVYQIYSKSSESEENFKALADKIKNLKDGEDGKMPLYIDEDHIIVGFRRDSAKVESKAVKIADTVINYCYDWYTGGFEGLTIKKPDQCTGKGCICLCEYKKDKPKDKGVYENWVRSAAALVTADVCNGKEDRCITEGLEQYNLIGEKGCAIAFIPGIKGKTLFGRDTIRSGLGTEERGVLPVQYKRRGNTITVEDEQKSREEIEKDILKSTQQKFDSIQALLKTKKKIYFIPVNWGKDQIEFNKAVDLQYKYMEEKTKELEDEFGLKIFNNKLSEVAEIVSLKYFECKVPYLQQEGISIRLRSDLIRCAQKVDSTIVEVSAIEPKVIGLTDDELWGEISGFTNTVNMIVSKDTDRIITAHEWGHMMGFCEEYKYSEWERENKQWKCLNPYPLCCADHPYWTNNKAEYKGYLEDRELGPNCFPAYEDISEEARKEWQSQEKYEKFATNVSCLGHACNPENEEYCRGLMGPPYGDYYTNLIFKNSVERSYLDKDSLEDFEYPA